MTPDEADDAELRRLYTPEPDSDFARGAKAMREACAALLGNIPPGHYRSLLISCAAAIRALPIPEDTGT